MFLLTHLMLGFIHLVHLVFPFWSLSILTENMFSEGIKRDLWHEIGQPVCFQCIFSLSPENIRKPQGPTKETCKPSLYEAEMSHLLK